MSGSTLIASTLLNDRVLVHKARVYNLIIIRQNEE